MVDIIGKSLGGHQVIEQLGRGGMAEVYKAYHPLLEDYRAIKVIREEFVQDDTFRTRFEREARSVASLKHPNIVQIHDFGVEDGLHYMVMEFVAGKDLKDIIETNGPIPPEQAAIWIRQVASALEFAHSNNVVHRDVKPQNIMIDERGNAILMDFGIARLTSVKSELSQNMVIGTFQYMAPEQLEGHSAGATADVFSLSVVLYEAITGRLPFDADTQAAVITKILFDQPVPPTQLNDSIDDDLQKIILKGTSKPVEERYQSAQAMVEALEAWENRPYKGGARSPGPRVDPAPATKSRSKLVPILLVSALGVLGLLAWAAHNAGWLTDQPTEPAPSPVPDRVVIPEQIPDPTPQPTPTPDRQVEPQPTPQPIPEDTTPAASDEPESSEPMADPEVIRPEPQSEVVSPELDLSATQPQAPVLKSKGSETSDKAPAPPVVDTNEVMGGNLSINQPIQGYLDGPDQTVWYELKTTTRTSVRLEVVNADVPLRIEMVFPSGRRRVFTSRSDPGEIELGRRGVYQIIVSALSSGSGNYTIAIREWE